MDEEKLIRLLRAFALIGIEKVRLTGGEPMLLPNLDNIVKNISQILGIKTIGLTTNGYHLQKKLSSLIEAGLNRLNISLDTLNRDKFKRITGIDGLNRVLEAVEMAEDSGVFPWVKVNTVIIRGMNDDEVSDFAKWSLRRKIDLRFIEFMKTKEADWEVDSHVSEAEIRVSLDLDLEPVNDQSESRGPAQSYKLKGYPGRISFVSAVSRGFCKACNRLRLNSSGDLIGCLFNEQKVNLLHLTEKSDSPEEIAEYIIKIVTDKRFKNQTGGIGEDYRPDIRFIGG